MNITYMGRVWHIEEINGGFFAVSSDMAINAASMEYLLRVIEHYVD